MNEQPPKSFQEQMAYENASRGIILEGLEFHKEVHDQEGSYPKVYHTSAHLSLLMKYEADLSDIFALSHSQQMTVEMATAWHDTIIEYDKVDPNNLLDMIHRHRGARSGDKPKGILGNEAKSAQLLKEKMQKVNEQEEKEIFTKDQIAIAVLAIEVTYPEIDLGSDFMGARFEEYPYLEIVKKQNPSLYQLLNDLNKQGITKGHLFFQPHLEKPLENGQSVPREALILALADLGTSGLDDREEFFRLGDQEMQELYENLSNRDVMKRLVLSDEDKDKINRENVCVEFIKWLDSQTGFVIWQSLRFEKIIYLLKNQNGISLGEEIKLRDKFSHYTDNILATIERSKELKAKTEQIKKEKGEKDAFIYLARTMHYNI